MKNVKLRSMKQRSVITALSGALVMGFGANAMADSTFDLVNALVQKGVLTEEEALPLLKGRENDIENADKKVKKATRLGISDAIDNATLYGDIRVRGEYRDGHGVGTSATGVAVDENRDRSRYKLTLGVKTTAGDFYTDLAVAMGAGGRSDNASFGSTSGANNKDTLFIKRAMVGWNATEWLTLEAGRIENPLYTTPMVWDGDLTFEGLSEKAKFKAGPAEIFLTAAQSQYLGDKRSFPDGGGTTTVTNELLAFQGGAKFAINENTSAKAALTYTTFTHDNNKTSGVFKPGIDTGTSASVASIGVNDLDTIEIPAEINFMASSNIGLRLFGDYVNNLSGNDRADAACAATTIAQGKVKVCGAGNDDTAWLLGVAIGSAPDLKAFEGNKMAKGDWSARIWYQDVGVYSVDPNAVDSDFMDSRVNMKGTIFKAQYNLRDNVWVNFAAGHAKRKNNDLGTAGAGDLALNLNDFNLFQLDLTYKF
jgi:polyhydroxyalkanoate synthesis regulator phasin